MRTRARRLRLAALVLGIGLLTGALTGRMRSVRALTLAALFCLARLLAGRWLHFAEVPHVARLYHGAHQV